MATEPNLLAHENLEVVEDLEMNQTVVEHMLRLPALNKDMIIEVSGFGREARRV